MGLFNELSFNCPACNSTITFQSKIGDLKLANYSLDNAPLLTIADINDDGKNGDLYCEACGSQLELEVRFIATPKVKGEIDDKEYTRTV